MASILVIDDDPQVRLLLREVLEEQGHIVRDAGDGREGLHIAQTASPDLVITDVLMPEVDGLEVMMALSRESPATRVIAFSGGVAEMDYLHAAKVLGAHRTLRKPLTNRELLHAVGEELQIASRTP
jgi:CheY-like chemotaxis protein